MGDDLNLRAGRDPHTRCSGSPAARRASPRRRRRTYCPPAARAQRPRRRQRARAATRPGFAAALVRGADPRRCVSARRSASGECTVLDLAAAAGRARPPLRRARGLDPAAAQPGCRAGAGGPRPSDRAGARPRSRCSPTGRTTRRACSSRASSCGRGATAGCGCDAASRHSGGPFGHVGCRGRVTAVTARPPWRAVRLRRRPAAPASCGRPGPPLRRGWRGRPGRSGPRSAGRGRARRTSWPVRATRASFAPTPPARMTVSGSMIAQIEAVMAAMRRLSSSTSATAGASPRAARSKSSSTLVGGPLSCQPPRACAFSSRIRPPASSGEAARRRW